MAKVKKKQQVLELRSEVDGARLDQMVAIMIRNHDAFMTVNDLLETGIIGNFSRPHGLVLKLAKVHYLKYGELPEVGNIRTDANAALAENPDALTHEEVDQLNVLLDYIFDPTEHSPSISHSKVYVRLAADTCRYFLSDRAAEELSSVVRKNGQVVVDLPALVNAFKARLAVIDSLGESQLGLAFPEGWHRREKVVLWSTGVDILDKFTGGGWRKGECILFMGPYGSCKTMLTIHGVAGSIKLAARQYAEALILDPKAKVPVVILMFTEGTDDDYRIRLISHLAQVPWKRLNLMTDIMAELSSSPTPAATTDTEYEATLFKGVDPESFCCETERVEAAVAMANAHLVLINCTSSNEKAGGVIGMGGVPQLANVVNAHIRDNPHQYPICFWLDHASALVDRMTDAGDMDKEAVRLALKNLPRHMTDQLGKPFGAPVAVMHQLSGEANSRGVAAMVHHTDSASCKSIAEYVDFAILTGPPDEHGLCKFTCTKHRREPGTSYRVARVVGAFNTIVDETKDHVMDFGSRTIKRKDEINSVRQGDLTQLNDNGVSNDDDDDENMTVAQHLGTI